MLTPSFGVVLVGLTVAPSLEKVSAWDMLIVLWKLDSASSSGVYSIVSAAGSSCPSNHVLVRSYFSVVTNSLECCTSWAQFGGTFRSRIWWTVRNWLSYTTWYCGGTNPFLGFKTNATLPACASKWPTYITSLDQGSYFGTPFGLVCNLESNIYTGHTNVR